MPHPFKLESGHNAEISHINHILPSRFQGAFWYHDMILWHYDIMIPLKSNWNTIKTSWTMGNKANYMHKIKIYFIHCETKDTKKIKQNSE